MTNMDIYKRGWIEFTQASYNRMSRYLKTMPQFGIDVEFYAGYPIKKTDAQTDTVVTNGKRQSLCFMTQSKMTSTI